MSESIAFDDRVLTVEEARGHMGISRATFYKLVNSGQLKITKLASRTVVTGRAIRQCLSEPA
jgi:excisionase family DNA binding protein